MFSDLRNNPILSLTNAGVKVTMLVYAVLQSQRYVALQVRIYDRI